MTTTNYQAKIDQHLRDKGPENPQTSKDIANALGITTEKVDDILYEEENVDRYTWKAVLILIPNTRPRRYLCDVGVILND